MLVRTFHFRRARCRSGQALVEFAVVALVLTFLVAGVLTFGFALFAANVLQQAADVGAMELARLPLPPTIEFPDLGMTSRSSTDPTSAVTQSGAPNLFEDKKFREQIFHERYLVVDLDSDLSPGQTLDQYFAAAPLVNQLLRSVMVFERTLVDGSERQLVRFPGAIVRNTNASPNYLTVLVPRVIARDTSVGDDITTSTTGRETDIEWLAVIEEIRQANGAGPLSLNSAVTGISPGMVALRINYPFQSGAMVGYQYQRADDSFTGNVADVLGEDVQNHPATAVDGSFEPPEPYELVVAADSSVDGYRTHAGQYGLGRLEAFGKQVRPYRKVLTAQAIYRREVFE